MALAEADYVRVLRFMQNQRFVVRQLPAIAAVSVFLVFFLIMLVLGQDAPSFSFSRSILIAAAIASIVGALIVFARKVIDPLILRRTISKQFKSSPVLQAEYQMKIDGEGLHADSELGSTTTKWQAIIRFVENETDFLFYTSKQFSLFVPKNVFDSDEQVDQFRSLAKRGLGERAIV